MSVDNVSGIIEKIALLGREFTIQTEFVPRPEPRIRTLAYDGGRLVTVREMGVDPGDASEDRLRRQIQEHHTRITANLYRRAAELQAAKGLAAAPPPRTVPVSSSAVSAGKGRPMPTIEPGSRLEQSVATRQAIGPFSLAFARQAPGGAEDYEALLAAAEAAIDTITRTPVFHQLRLDEQLTFIALRGQIATWRLSDENPEVAADVWSNLEPFARHLQRISDRAELVAFDHELLTWAISELGKGIVSDQLIAGLQALAGRDEDLDRLVARPTTTTPHALLEVLIGILDRTLV